VNVELAIGQVVAPRRQECRSSLPLTLAIFGRDAHSVAPPPSLEFVRSLANDQVLGPETWQRSTALTKSTRSSLAMREV
jgi:hypothetical protein